MPLVSVIMPSYNHERFLSEAIQSVLNQSLNDLELIIIDDASGDSSRKIIEDFRERDERIRVRYHERNMGIARTMNDGIEAAKGQFVAFTASDDVWLKEKLEKQVEVLETNDDVVVWSEGEIIDAEGNLTGELFLQKHKAAKRKKSGDIFEELLKGNFVFGQSRVVKRENVRTIRFSESLKYLSDYQFEVDLASRYRYHFMRGPLARYRIHGGNTINSDREGLLRDVIMVGKYFLQKYDRKMTNKTKAHIFLTTSIAYSHLGDKANARRFIYQAIRHNTFNPIYLVFALTKEDGFVRNILRWGRDKYKRCVTFK